MTPPRIRDPGSPLRVLVSGENLSKGGGRTVLRSTLGELSKGDGVRCTAFVPQGFPTECPGDLVARTRLIERPRWSPVEVRRAAGDADVLLSLGNWAVPGVHVPQAVLVHWPYALYDDQEIWSRMGRGDRLRRSVKRRLFRSLVHRADLVLLQTAVAQRRLEARYPGLSTGLLPNVVPTRLVEQASQASAPPSDTTGDEGEEEILVLARYYPHKNFDVLVPVAEQIRDQGLPWRLVTTLDPEEDPGVVRFLDSARAAGVEGIIRNVGPIPPDGLESAYRRSSALLLPSLLESFSGVYLEAMAFGVPVVTSDRDFAHAVCGDAALYVDPLDPGDILRGLRKVLDHPEERRALTAAGRRRLKTFPTAAEVGAGLVDALKALARGARVSDPESGDA